MNVDKNLFIYDLAVVAIMKNEGPYVKEWLDYHLLAGVNHFFIYDNESEDNLKEVLQPYIDAELVTYTFFPGKGMQMEAYNAAIENLKFHCRYMAFIDADEFIFPRVGWSITEVADDFVTPIEKLGGLAIPMMLYGSNNQTDADLTRPVIERFTRRKSQEVPVVKTILNPRTVDYMWTPHFAEYITGIIALGQDSINLFVKPTFNLAKVISINQYMLKSQEEFVKRKSLGEASCGKMHEDLKETFKKTDAELNEVFDDSILKYRDARIKKFLLEGDVIKTFSAINQPNYDRLLQAVTSNLLPGFMEDDTKKFLDNPKNRFEYFAMLIKFFSIAPQDFFKGRTETFLTCFAVSSFLKENFVDEELGSLLEEFSLRGIIKSLYTSPSTATIYLLLKEMPKLLSLPYAEVDNIRIILSELLIEVRNNIHNDINHEAKLPAWKDILDLDYKIKMLKAFDNYRHNQT